MHKIERSEAVGQSSEYQICAGRRFVGTLVLEDP